MWKRQTKGEYRGSCLTDGETVMIPVRWVKLNHSKQLMANKSRAAALAVNSASDPSLGPLFGTTLAFG
jgi:hypothetical protein